MARPVTTPPPRRLISLALPGMASLLLYSVFVFSADFYNGTPDRRGPGYYVLASWGLLTGAAVLAAITFVQAASLFAELLGRDTDSAGAGPAGEDLPRRTRITGGLLLAAAGAVSTCVLYAVTAAVYFAYPISDLLRWSLLPVLPLLAGVLVTATLAWWRPLPAERSWDTVLAFPISSVVTAGAGLGAVAAWWHSGLPWWVNGYQQLIGQSGGFLIGVGVSCAVVRHAGVRAGLIAVLGFFCVLISQAGPDILAVLYACAAAVWISRRAWGLFRNAAARTRTMSSDVVRRTS